MVFSAKNTFFLPRGSIGSAICHCFPRSLLQIKKLDIAFDMQDIKARCLFNFQSVKPTQDTTPGATPYDELTSAERWHLLHEERNRPFFDYAWASRIYASIRINRLDLLRLNLTDCWCVDGCCRLGLVLLRFLNTSIDQGQRPWHPKRIEIVGMLQREQHACRDILAHGGKISLDRVFFVGSPGCT